MTTSTNHWKLGLFVVVGMFTGLAVLFWLGIASAARETVLFSTYFNESVNGLDVGAPVKFRGVTVGKVRDITVAPDQRLVQVDSTVYLDVLERLGLADPGMAVEEAVVPADMRMQLATIGVTGVKYLLVDFFDERGPVPPHLDFDPPARYIPSTSSTLKSVEDTFYTLGDALPSLLERGQDLLDTLDAKAQELDVVGLSNEAKATFERLNAQLEKLDELDFAGQAQLLMSDLRDATSLGRKLLARFDGPDDPLERALASFESLNADAGVAVRSARQELESARLGETLESVRSTSDAYRGLAGEAGNLAPDLRTTLAQLRDTLATLQALAHYLEREPGALLRGRAPENPPPTHWK